jgi:hypothetical protein
LEVVPLEIRSPAEKLENPAAAEFSVRAIDDDAQKPAAQGRWVSQLREVDERLRKCLLDHVFGVGPVPDEPPGDPIRLGHMLAIKRLLGPGVAVQDARDELGIVDIGADPLSG